MTEEKQPDRLEDVRSQLAFSLLNTDLFKINTINKDNLEPNTITAERIEELEERMNQTGTSPFVKSKLKSQIKVLKDTQRKITCQRDMSLKEKITFLQELQVDLRKILKQKRRQFNQEESVNQKHPSRKRKRENSYNESLKQITQPQNHIALLKRFDCFPSFPEIPNLNNMAYGETFGEKVIKLCYRQYVKKLEKYIRLGYPFPKIEKKLYIDLKNFVETKLPPYDAIASDDEIEECMIIIYKDNVNAIFQKIASSLNGYASSYFSAFQELYLGKRGTLSYLKNMVDRLTFISMLEQKLSYVTPSKSADNNSLATNKLHQHLILLRKNLCSSWMHNIKGAFTTLRNLDLDLSEQDYNQLSLLLNKVKTKYSLAAKESYSIADMGIFRKTVNPNIYDTTIDVPVAIPAVQYF